MLAVSVQKVPAPRVYGASPRLTPLSRLGPRALGLHGGGPHPTIPVASSVQLYTPSLTPPCLQLQFLSGILRVSCLLIPPPTYVISPRWNVRKLYIRRYAIRPQ